MGMLEILQQFELLAGSHLLMKENLRKLISHNQESKYEMNILISVTTILLF